MEECGSEYCNISGCDAEAVWKVIDEEGAAFYLCETCHEAFDLANSSYGWEEEYL
jgi:hypothetical protein